MELNPLKGTGIDPNSLLPKETAEKFEVVDWNFGPLIHYPSMARLGKPNGRVCLTDLDPRYAGRLVDAGFKHLRRKEVKPAKPSEAVKGEK